MEAMATDDCIFCRIVRGELPSEKVAETPEIVSILDIHPIAPGHVLVIPKAHHELLTDLPGGLLTETIREAQRVARAALRAAGAEGFNLLNNNHRCSGQAIPHVHFHVIPRRSGDGIRFNWSPVQYADGELAQWGAKIRAGL
jgi:histidine triad (HIT) family protein